MNDLISRQALQETMYHEAFETDSDMQKWDSGCWIRYKMFENVVEALPSVEPENLQPTCNQLATDCISRQAAIDALAEHEKSNGHNYTLFVDIVSECAEIIRDLPAAQPEIIRCKDCKYRGVGDYCVYGTRLAWVTKSNDFCSKAERRTDEE